MKIRIEPSHAVVDEGVYSAELVEIIEGDSQYGATAKFLFKLLDIVNQGDESPVISGICSLKKGGQTSPSTKLFRWLTVLNGGDSPDLHSQVDPEDFIGVKVKLSVKNNTKDGDTFSNVDQLIQLIDPPF